MVEKNFSTCIQNILSKFKNNPGFHYGILVNDWEKIVGSDLSKVAKPNKLVQKNILVLQASHAARLELFYQKSEIIRSINIYLGRKAIKDIIFC